MSTVDVNNYPVIVEPGSQATVVSFSINETVVEVLNGVCEVSFGLESPIPPPSGVVMNTYFPSGWL